MEVYWGPGCQMYVTPVSARRSIGRAAHARSASARGCIALPHFPELARRLRGAGTLSEERGAVTVTRRLEANLSRTHGVDWRCLRFRGCHHRRRHEPGLSTSHRAGRCAGREQLGAVSIGASPHGAPSGIHGSTDADARPLSPPAPAVLRTFAAKPVIFERLLAVHVGA